MCQGHWLPPRSQERVIRDLIVQGALPIYKRMDEATTGGWWSRGSRKVPGAWKSEYARAWTIGGLTGAIIRDDGDMDNSGIHGWIGTAVGHYGGKPVGNRSITGVRRILSLADLFTRRDRMERRLDYYELVEAWALPEWIIDVGWTHAPSTPVLQLLLSERSRVSLYPNSYGTDRRRDNPLWDYWRGTLTCTCRWAIFPPYPRRIITDREWRDGIKAWKSIGSPETFEPYGHYRTKVVGNRAPVGCTIKEPW